MVSTEIPKYKLFPSVTHQPDSKRILIGDCLCSIAQHGYITQNDYSEIKA